MTDSILVYPDPRLRQRAEPVGEITPAIRERALGLVALMNQGGEDASGIGLAATQVGWPVRIMVVKTIDHGKWGEDVILVNPRVLSRGEGREIKFEGCLSFPGIEVRVERDREISVEGHDLEGQRRVLAADGIVARCLQHELDHLDGLTMIDRLTPTRRASIAGKLKALERRSRGD